MSYAGICNVDNILPIGDPDYFGVYSHIEMTNHLANTDCYKIQPSGNTIPTLTVPADGFTIPKETPFYLEAQASDTDGDLLTYSWEQTNINGIHWNTTSLSIQVPPTASDGDVPIQRIFNPTTDSVRVIPQLSDLLANNYNNSANVNERLPTYTRNIRYTCYVRDNHPGAGTGLLSSFFVKIFKK